MSAPKHTDSDEFTSRQFARLLGVSRWTFGRLRAEGRLPPPTRMDGARPLWCRKVVEVWHRERTGGR